MEDEASLNRSAFAKPSVDPLDAMIEAMDAERAAASQGASRPGATGQEPKKDETTSTVATAHDEPKDDDFEDDVKTDVTKIPDTDDDDDDDTLQESEHQRRPATVSKDETKERQDEDSDDEPRLSRKQRGKLITELRQELEREQSERKRLEDSLSQQREADAALNKEVERALGTDDQIEKALQDGLAGDEQAAKNYQVYKANRDFYKKLVEKAGRDQTTEFMTNYWEDVSGLPGVTQESLQAPTLKAILKNLYDAGVSSVKGSSNDEIEKLQKDVATWRGRYRDLKAKAGGEKQSPLSGSGSETPGAANTDWKKRWIDPKTGMFTDEADQIVNQFGFKALMDPSLIKR